MKNNDMALPKGIIYDRGGKWKSKITGVKILTPDKPKKSDTPYQKVEETQEIPFTCWH